MKLGAIKSGTYIVAVSGGVDSVVLLDALSKQKDIDLVVAHFDHGIRDDSANDKKFVENLAQKYNLPFVYSEGKLGAKASEATARQARYKFLETTRQKHQAEAIITAHHQDDLIETMLLNLLRGTGRKGMTSLSNQDKIVRPLLGVTKQELIEYAQDHKLQWHEDSTNADTSYLRNWIRLTLIPKLTNAKRQQLLDLHKHFTLTNQEIDDLLTKLITPDKTLSRALVIRAEHTVAKEIVAGWLRANNISEFDQKIIERIVIGSKTLQPGKFIPVLKNWHVAVQKSSLVLQSGAKTLHSV